MDTANENRYATKENPNWSPVPESLKNIKVAIVQIRGGFTAVGVVADDGEKSGTMTLDFPQMMARWGTDGVGIGALCFQGPREETKLYTQTGWDGGSKINRNHVLEILYCDPSVWLKTLGVPEDYAPSVPDQTDLPRYAGGVPLGEVNREFRILILGPKPGETVARRAACSCRTVFEYQEHHVHSNAGSGAPELLMYVFCPVCKKKVLVNT